MLISKPRCSEQNTGKDLNLNLNSPSVQKHTSVDSFFAKHPSIKYGYHCFFHECNLWAHTADASDTVKRSQVFINEKHLHGDDAPGFVPVGLAGVVVVERVEDGVGLVAEVALADGGEVKAQVVQEELHLHPAVARVSVHRRGPAQDQGGGAHLTALHELRQQSQTPYYVKLHYSAFCYTKCQVYVIFSFPCPMSDI